MALLASGAGSLDEKKNNNPAANDLSATAPDLAGTLETLRREYPDAYRAGRGARDISQMLLAALGGKSGTAEERAARILSAEALEAAGDEAGARRLRELVRAEGPTGSDRARAAFALGLSQFLRERYDGAERYFRIIPELEPGSIWAARAARFQPYFEILRSKSVPPFAGTFGPPEGPGREMTSAGLQGRYAILHFWSSSLSGGKAGIQGLVRMRKRLAAKSGLPVELYGINLDSEAEPFRRSAREWGIDWPQHHDGLCFAGPLPRAFGIPRLPHYLALGPDGRAVYLGADLDRMEKAATPDPRPR